MLAVTALAVAIVLPRPDTASPFAAAPEPRRLQRLAGAVRRRLDEVVFPATHNSYAAADEPGWFFANQRHGIERQLRDGIRGFLIDIHYGVRDPLRGRVRTDLGRGLLAEQGRSRS